MTSPLGGVTASSAAAADAGAQILDRGGNAVDAAVATALASCVADPGNTGIGGYGGHMIVAPSGGEPVCIDFNMWLPAYWPDAAYRRTYPNFNPLVTSVPNVVAGLARAVERFGSMQWSQLVEPAVGLAAAGVEANGTTSRAFKEVEGADFVKDCFSFDALDARVKNLASASVSRR
jgi:gamma-glutamyltranspeptidase / glutathione hydrolase